MASDKQFSPEKVFAWLFVFTAAEVLFGIAFHDAPKPASNEVILGVVTSDVDAFCARAVAAGGAVAEAPHAMPELKIKVGFVTDVEGHWIEVVQPLA